LPLLRRLRAAVESADIVVIVNHWVPLNILVAHAAWRLRKPTVVVPSGALPVRGRSRWLKRLFNAAGGRRIIRDAALHIATTAGEVNEFVSYGVNAGHVHLIPNAIELPERSVFAAGLPSPFILFAGRLFVTKGPDLLLQAFLSIANRIPHNLVLAGQDRGMLDTLRSTAARTAFSHRIHFTGYLSPAQLEPVIAASDVVVVPSKIDWMPHVILEAGAHARPTIITDRCGAAEFAEAGVVHMTSANEEGIAAALLDILSTNDRGASLGRSLYGYVKSHYTSDNVVGRYLKLFQGIAREPRSDRASVSSIAGACADVASSSSL
jgi:glycosyltransferase involved in cell wall biosynthesis